MHTKAGVEEGAVLSAAKGGAGDEARQERIVERVQAKNDE